MKNIKWALALLGFLLLSGSARAVQVQKGKPSLGNLSGELRGTRTNDDAGAGIIGQYISSATVAASVATSGQFGNAGQLSLTAGDWDVDAVCELAANGATVTQAQMAISVNTGNTTTDHVSGDNQISLIIPIATNGAAGAISNYRKSLSGTTTVFVKAKATYTVATPTRACRISARRVR